MNTNSNQFWMDPEEQEFLLSHIRPGHTMLEYGSGNSTIVLKDMVKYLTSIEHHDGWYNQVQQSLSLNDSVDYRFVPPNNPQWEQQFDSYGRKNVAGDDGSFEDFASYVTAPRNAKFDIIFIDGRARVACAWMAQFILVEDGLIFIHDFGPLASHPYLPYRTYYDTVFEWLAPVEQVKTMAAFRVRVK